MMRMILLVMLVVMHATLPLDCHAGGELYLNAYHGFRDDSGRGGVGLTVHTDKPGPYLGLRGEVGGVLADQGGMDYLLEPTAGWKFGTMETSLTTIGVAGYRQFAIHEVPGSAPETAYAGGGLRLQVRPFYLVGKARYDRRDKAWLPSAEMGIQFERMLFGIFYEEPPTGGAVTGMRYGVRF